MASENFNLLKKLIYFDTIMFNIIFIGKLYLTDEMIKIHNGSSAAPRESVKCISKGYNRIYF